MKPIPKDLSKRLRELRKRNRFDIDKILKEYYSTPVTWVNECSCSCRGRRFFMPKNDPNQFNWEEWKKTHQK